MSWEKLYERDNWGSITVCIGQYKMTNGTIDSEPGVPSLKTGRYYVRWPDGTCEFLDVVMKPYRRTIGDMGHDYEVSGEKPYFVLKIHGALITIFAPTLGVEVLV